MNRYMKENYIINNLGTFISKTYFSFVVKIRIFILNFLYNRTIKEIKESEEYYYFYKEKKKNNSNAFYEITLNKLGEIFRTYINLFFELYTDKFYNQLLHLEILLIKKGDSYLEYEKEYGIEKIRTLKYKMKLIHTAMVNIINPYNLDSFFNFINYIEKGFYSYRENFNEVIEQNSINNFEYIFQLNNYLKDLEKTETKLSNQEKVKRLNSRYEEFNDEVRKLVKFNSLDVIYTKDLKCVLEANLIKELYDLNLFFETELGQNLESDFFDSISTKISSNKRLLKYIGRIEKMSCNYKHYYFELDSVNPIKELSEFEYNIPLNEALEIIKKALAPLGKEYLTKLYKGINLSYSNIKKTTANNVQFENAEAYIRYDDNLNDNLIYINYDPTSISDLFALAHELGHYCDSNILKTSKNAIEINSQLAELMLYNYLKETKKDDLEFMIILKKYMYEETIREVTETIKMHFIYLLSEELLTNKSEKEVGEEFLSELYYNTLQKYYDNHHILIGNSPSAHWIWAFSSYNAHFLEEVNYIFGISFANYLVENFKNEEFKNSYLDNFLNSNLDEDKKINIKYYLDKLELEDMEKVINSYIHFVEVEISSFYTLLNKYKNQVKNRKK